jgi:hypothetical protein
MPKLENGFYKDRDNIDSNININLKSNYKNRLFLMITCPYDKTKNLTNCPKCKKSDKVVPNITGLPIYDSLGNINGQPATNFHLTSCIVDLYCNPTKHCKRCHLDF